MDIQVGKNKYKVTATLLMAAGAILVSAISWFTMLQVDMTAMQKDITNLNEEVKYLERNWTVLNDGKITPTNFSCDNRTWYYECFGCILGAYRNSHRMHWWYNSTRYESLRE